MTTKEEKMRACSEFLDSMKEMKLKIDWETATAMLQAYQGHPRAILLNPGVDNKITQGFYVDKSEMQAVINSTPGDTIILMPAIHPEDLGKPSNQQNITIIFAALKADRTIDTEMNFDYCLPCPYACPGNYPG
ncbi:MAG: hypothetical protein HYZ14_07195 [Bacteroidetes bacterium]|nr:hypothetical protein [Bacteroidota bacterium]